MYLFTLHINCKNNIEARNRRYKNVIYSISGTLKNLKKLEQALEIFRKVLDVEED